MAKRSKAKLKFVAGFTLFFAALWFLWETPVVYPLKIFVVLLHEVSHAMVAVATGGSIDRITLDPRQGGACHCPGGNAFLTLSAGYLGSLVWGGLMLSAARSSRIKAEWVNGLIGALVIGLTLLFVRNGFGFVFGVIFGLAMIAVSQKLGDAVNRPLLLTLGLTSALYAILDIKSDILDRPEVRSDAYMLAEVTGVPTVAWGFLWIGAGLGFSFWLLRRAYRDA
ncbi:MAG: M50 family peptidase [Gemmatimonadetes bacterium]|nr:M50 family peptidase [Gemmatimonadota bacterium]